MKKILYYDCFAGISGDMNLGALIDLGVDAEHLKNELKKLNIDGFHLAITSDKRKGIAGTKASVMIHQVDNQKHRHLHHVEEIINNSSLSDKVKHDSLKIFRLIAEAEARVHNIDIQKVHFHEVGALDSIVDIVGAAICLDYLKVDEVLSSPIQLGGGFVMCDHGKMPVPAPATAEIVKNIPVRTGGVNHEATTPTGAAILAATVTRFAEKTDFTITKRGHGIGHRDTELPNILRVYLAESEEAVSGDILTEEAVMLECNIDDMNPEWFEHVSALLFEAGASEVFLTPVIMKKSRSANVLSVLSKNNLAGKLKEIIFTHTTTIGLREIKVMKNFLKREEFVVETSLGKVRFKRSFLNGKQVNIKPEYDDLRSLALANNMSVQEVSREVMKSV
ncbi:MAG: nickel pincer cofactor biosynthesis protein LarC [Bacteroidales bacterium]|nr:nickel pincer cofactor biosynthesis protein LarC [Bacteroidales bacterium]MCB9013818.1 nickel pincer cofactor biosynthesis protein LarC [Bacteroidales bacterium]